MLLGGGCTAAIVAVFHPLDSVRIRWQVLHASRGGVAPAGAESMVAFALGVARHEGLVGGLWRPGVAAHSSATFVSSSFRLGVYPTLRDALVGEGTKNALHMWVAGFCAGTVGFFFASPLFMAKVRLQVSAGDRSLALVNRSATGVLVAVARAEGLRGLWRGSGTLVARGALLSSGSQLGYDWTKTKCKCEACSASAPGAVWSTAACRCGGWLADGPVLHLLASVASAFLASAMAAPLDLVLTRYQAAPLLGVHYNGVLHCIGSIARNEGLPGFYRGFLPLFLRLAPLWSVSLPFYEATRRLVGLSYMT